MSAVSDSAPGAQKRSLAELLAGRVKRPDRKAEENCSKLQEAALYLLSCQQDPSRFLCEVEAPPFKKTCITESSESRTVPALAESFISSTLRDQASRLGLQVGVLTAKAAASSIQQICQTSVDREAEALLSAEQRATLSCLVKALKGLIAENCFSRSLFSKELWKTQRPPVLEAVWQLHNEEILQLEELLESCTDPSIAVEWFCSEMRSLCVHMENASSVPELPERISSAFLTVLIESGFRKSSDPGKESERPRVAEISVTILDKMLSWLLSAVFEGQCEQTYKPSIERHWLIAFEVPRYRIHVNPQSVETFFVHTLTHVLTHMPKLKVSDAVRCQGNWSFVKTCPLLTDLYRKLFVALSAEKFAAHIQLILETQEVNWHHVLTCVSCLVIYQSEAEQLVKDLLSRLLTQAFESYELECLITAFLIARQSALEGPAAFVPYTEWFKCTFGSASAYHCNSKKSLVFLLKFLSDLVPFEAPQYLKVHILHPPFVPTKYRSLLMEYISLAKTRLADLKVSIEDMGLYEDLSAASDKVQPQSQAQADVEKAIRIFENTGKIPASVMEASIFRRPYFTSRFLPALLAPRVLPTVPDPHMLLADSLKRADKIPSNIFNAYLESCEQEKHRRLSGSQGVNRVLQEEPLERLRSALCDLRPLVTDTYRYDDVSAQVAIISERLTAVTGGVKGADILVIPESINPTTAVTLELQDQTVADLLLTSFCQCVMAASCSNPPDRQGHWPSLYVKMLLGHVRPLSAILKRMVQLVYLQAPLLSDSHVVGLAAFSIHLHECRTSLSNEHSLERFWDALLNAQKADTMSICLKFCTAAVSYAFCRFSLLSPNTAPDCLPPSFLRKLQHLMPRLIWETRGEVISKGVEEMPLPWTSLSLPSADWKDAALSLWRQSYFQNLLRKESFQISFRDWLLYELSLNSTTDVLCDTERQDYQRWAMNLRYLPESSAAGGCEGDIERACTVMVEAVLEFCSSSGENLVNKPKNVFLSHSRAGLADIMCRLQELVCDLIITHHSPLDNRSFLFKVFRQRLAGAAGQSEMSSRLTRQREVTSCCRVLLALPPLLLITTPRGRGVASATAEDFFSFVNEELKNLGPRGCALPYNITLHFFRGILSCGSQVADSAESINSLLEASYSKCPIILSSAALWWPQMSPVLGCQMVRLLGGDVLREFVSLRELQAAVDSCISTGSSLPLAAAPWPLAGAPWLLAAFVYFTIYRKRLPYSAASAFLAALGTNAEQFLVSLLFFSIMDLIPALLKEGSEDRSALQNCVYIIHSLEERGGCWASLFLPSEQRETELCLVLYKMSSKHFLNLLPLVFYSLVPSLQMEHLVKQQNFLVIALQMYKRLLELFLDGEVPSDTSITPQQLDCRDLLTRGRQVLLCLIPRCPQPSTLLRNQLLELCGDYDPELAAVIQSSFQPSPDDELYKEPNLFCDMEL